MLIYNVGFINTDGKHDCTQLNIEMQQQADAEIVEMMNLILSLKDEMDIKEITYIDYIGCDDGEDE